MLDFIYITEARAREVGLTHKGTLYGVPAWFAGNDDGDICRAVPKAPILLAWCWLAGKLLDVFVDLTPEDMVIMSAITITGRI